MPSLPAGLPPPGQRIIPKWATGFFGRVIGSSGGFMSGSYYGVKRTVPATYASATIIFPAIALTLPLFMIVGGFFADESGRLPLIISGLVVAAFPGLILLVQGLRVRSMINLYQYGEVAPQEIMWSDFESRSGETITSTRTFVMEYWFTLAGGKDRLKFVVNARKLQGVPFPPAQGDTVLVVYDRARPKRHEVYGFVAADGRWWVPGKSA